MRLEDDDGVRMWPALLLAAVLLVGVAAVLGVQLRG